MKAKKKKKFEQKQLGPLPLVPQWLLFVLWLVALGVPNLVFSGDRFADPLFIIKWVVALVPVGVAVLVAGARMLCYGGERLTLRLDPFALLMGLMLLYCAAQPLWVDISSARGMIQELACLAAVWAFYVLSADSFPGWGLRPLLLLASLNAAINVLFAELRIHNLHTLAFLQGTPFEFLRPLSALIYAPARGYEGNTGQRNMFGLWLAVCAVGSIYLFLTRAVEKDGKKPPRWEFPLNLVLLLAILFGLWRSVSRSGLLALGVGLFVLAVTGIFRFGRAYAKRLGVVLLLCLALGGAGLMLNFLGSNAWQRNSAIRMVNIKDLMTFGKRIGLWGRSYAMLRDHPMGVGLGQYKWHFLEAQREAFKTGLDFGDGWRYTLWAHNEFLQWFCEGGVIGGVMLLLLFAVWLAAVFRRAGREFPLEAMWGCAVAALFAFDALWTRPFHRVETLLWLALAFAISGRGFMRRVTLPRGFLRPAGAVFACASVAGLLCLGGGVQGNLLIRRALNATTQPEQIRLLEDARQHLMTWEQAQRIQALSYLKNGEARNDIAMAADGFNMLWASFRREPDVNDRGPLLDWAQRFRKDPIIREIASYQKPGTYHFAMAQAVDAKGRTVEGLVVLDGPAPEESGGASGESLERRESLESRES